MATEESAAHDDYKAAVVALPGTETARTSMFGPEMPEFNPMRVLRNRIVRQWENRVAEIPADTSGEPVIGQMDLLGRHLELHRFSNLVPMRGATVGDVEEMALPAGQGVGLVQAVEPAASVIARMTADAVAMLGKYGRG